MARSAKTTAAAEPKPAPRKAAAPAKPAPAAPRPVLPARKPAPAPAPATPARVPPPSKGELRAHIEKLETANAALKAKSRETNRVAKIATKRIAELETELAQMQDQAARPVAAPAAEKAVRRGRQGRGREVDPGDAVPPGVAVREPEPLDAEAEAVRDALEENLSGE